MKTKKVGRMTRLMVLMWCFSWNFGKGCQLSYMYLLRCQFSLGLNPWLPYENLAWPSASWSAVRSLRHVKFPSSVHPFCSVKFMPVLHVDWNYGWGWKRWAHKSQWTACSTLQPYDVVFADVRVVVLVVVRCISSTPVQIQGGSNMTGTDLYVNKPHCAAAVRPWES